MSTPNVETIAAELAELRREVGYLRDRQAILDAIARYTRAVDRHEWSLLPTVYRDDGIANHGSFVGYYPDFEKWLGERLRTTMHSHMHTILNHNCWIDGDTAIAETYAIVYTEPTDRSRVNMLGARYVDHFVKADGQWKIQLRRIALDWRCHAESMADTSGFPEGKWGREDLSYMRPLELTAELKAEVAKLTRPERG
jgi:hypothetical protein